MLGVALTLAQAFRAAVPALAGPDVIGVVLHNTTCLLAAGLVARRAVVRPDNRVAWGCLAAGLLAYALGFLVFRGIVVPLGLPRFPSPADALWLAFYPLAYLSLVLLLRARVSRWHRSLWLDGIVAALGLAAFAMDTAFVHLLDGGGGHRWATLTNLAYPTADLVLLALVLASFAILGWRANPSLLLLGGGLLLLVAGDVGYLVQVSNGAQTWTSSASAPWLVGLLLMATAAWVDRGGAPMRPSQGWMLLLQPVFFLLSSAALLTHGALMTRQADTVVVLLAMACVTAACARMVLTYREVRALADVREQARTDELTGLANRRQLDHDLRTLQEARADFAVLLVDLDRFKEVNDSFGHAVGDELLVAVAQRMEREVTAVGGLLARMGGDEFGVVLPGAGDPECTALAARLRAALDDPFDVGAMALHVEASIGAAMSPEHGSDAGGLLRGRTWRCTSPSAATSATRSSSRAPRTTPACASRRSRSCAPGSRARRSSPTTSLSSTCAPAGSPASRRSPGGSTRSAGCSDPAPSSTSPSRQASSDRSSSGSPAARSGTRAGGATRAWSWRSAST